MAIGGTLWTLNKILQENKIQKTPIVKSKDRKKALDTNPDCPSCKIARSTGIKNCPDCGKELHKK